MRQRSTQPILIKFGKQTDANSKFSGGTSSTDLKSSQLKQPKKSMKVSLDAWHDKCSNDTKTSKKATIENITIENLSDTEKIPKPMQTEKHQDVTKKALIKDF